MNKKEPNKSELILYQTEDGKTRLEVRLQDETVWLTQKMMSDLFQVAVPTINEHIKNIYVEGELASGATIREFLIVQKEAQHGAFLKFNEREILNNPGKVSKEVADKLALEHYQVFNQHRLEVDAKQEAIADDNELKQIQSKIEKKKRKKNSRIS